MKREMYRGLSLIMLATTMLTSCSQEENESSVAFINFTLGCCSHHKSQQKNLHS